MGITATIRRLIGFVGDDSSEEAIRSSVRKRARETKTHSNRLRLRRGAASRYKPSSPCFYAEKQTVGFAFGKPSFRFSQRIRQSVQKMQFALSTCRAVFLPGSPSHCRGGSDLSE
jgi:hypothetical protein